MAVELSSISVDGHGLVRALWPEVPKQDFPDQTYARLISYVESEFRMLISSEGSSSTDFHDELNVLCILKEEKDSPRYAVLEAVRVRCGIQDEAQCRALIELAARIWLTVNIDSFGIATIGYTSPPSAKATWNDKEMSLRTLVQNQFPTSVTDYQSGEKLPLSLTMMELCSRSKYSVRWTHNLLEHLTIREERGSGVILVYEHLICLLNHRKYPDHSAIPEAIVEEALDTFVVLFPLEDKRTKRFLKREKREFYSVGYGGRGCKRQLQLDHYQYWRKSMAQMGGIMANPPRGWRQAILDTERRNFEQVSTIWFGAIATVLTVVALVFGVLSTLLAMSANRLAAEANSLANESLNLGREANKLARDAYELDRRQACLEPNATENLPDFCP